MKKTLLSLLLIISLTAGAQELEHKIPLSVDAVISIKASRLLDIISLEQFSKYKASEILLRNANRKREHKINSIGDFGVDLNSTCYYSYEKTDSISYHYLYLKIDEKEKFTNNFSDRAQKLIKKTKSGANILFDESNTFIWNDDIALISFAKISKQYYKKRGDYNYSTCFDLQAEYLFKKTLDIFNLKKENSILLNKEYVKSKSKMALASIWLKDYSVSIGDLDIIKKLTRNINVNLNSTKFKSFTCDLYFNKGDIRLVSNLSFDESVSKSFKKIYNSKINNSFFDYLDIDNIMAYASLSINAENLLIEAPKLMENIYGEMIPEYKSEIATFGKLITCFLDEKAIANLISGNALFMLNKYDKSSLSPSYTLMIESKDAKIVNKLFSLAEKHNMATIEKGIVCLHIPSKIKDDLFLTHKDNILFISSSREEIGKILNKNTKKTNSQHKSLIKNNVSVIYIDTAKMFDRLSSKNTYSSQHKLLVKTSDKIKDITLISSNPKNNKFKSEFIIHTKSDDKNSLLYVLDLIEDMLKR